MNKKSSYLEMYKSKEKFNTLNAFNNKILEQRINLKSTSNQLKPKKKFNHKRLKEYKINDFIKEINNKKYNFTNKTGFHQIPLLERQQLWLEARDLKLKYKKSLLNNDYI